MDYTVKALEGAAELSEYRRSCVNVEKFLGYCRACPSYGRVWSCPPYDFDPREVWDRYRHLALYARVLTPLPGATYGGMMAALRREKELLLDFLLEKEGETPGSMALSAGNCSLCPVCGRPEGKPCLHPDRMRYSIEALGGDVAATAERCLGFPLLWAEKGTLPAYFALVGGLLT